MVAISENTNVIDTSLLLTPRNLKQRFPADEALINSVIIHRETIQDILDGRIKRFITIIGPCSMRSYEEVMEYARWMRKLMDKFPELFFIIRLCPDKPRSGRGWPGFAGDPFMDDSCDMNFGLSETRRIFVDVAKLGIPIAMEAYGFSTIHYLSDIVSYAWIGARTVTDGNHRKMASGLSMLVGFKNRDDGAVTPAIAAIDTANHPHYFPGIDDDARLARQHGKGNKYAHLILRGGANPNHDEASIRDAHAQLKKAGLRESILIDANHGNSGKKPERQKDIVLSVADLKLAGFDCVMGVIVESDILGGAHQKFPNHASKRTYGLSVTDACLSIPDSDVLVEELARKFSSKFVEV